MWVKCNSDEYYKSEKCVVCLKMFFYNNIYVCFGFLKVGLKGVVGGVEGCKIIFRVWSLGYFLFF